jgi:hypothetical protein
MMDLLLTTAGGVMVGFACGFIAGSVRARRLHTRLALPEPWR